MQKVAIFLDYYYVGGIENVISNIYNNLKDIYNINILSFVSKDNSVKGLLKGNYSSFGLRNILGLIKLRKHFKNNKYDIIHINCYNAFGLIYAYMSRKYVKKVIVHAHNSNVDNDFLKIKSFINYLIKLIFNSNKYIYIGVSDEACNFCFMNKDYTLIPNSVDYEKFKENKKIRKYYRNKYNINDKIVIGHIGRFVEQKNHDFIINVFNEICKIKDNYILVLVGEGKLYNKIMTKVKRLNLEDKVLYFKYRNDIDKFINMFDIYLFPSIYEGFGITLLENQINDKEVFTSDNVPRVLNISNKIHFLSLKNNPKYWANEIINYKNKKLILKKDLDIDNYIKKIKEIYNR